MSFREVGAQLRNWGRWGPDDERGTLNHVTPDRIARAAATVTRGAVFDLGVDFGPDGPQPPGGERFNPALLVHETGAGQQLPGGAHYADDVVVLPTQAATQWDALAHVWYDDRLYNGFPADEIGPRGAPRCSVDRLGGVVARGVLLDVARQVGVDWLPGGYAITAALLDEVAAAQGVDPGPGDVLLVRTGWWRKFATDRDARAWRRSEPGLALDTCAWLHERDIAAVCADNLAVEVLSAEPAAEFLPVHMVLIRDMGMPLGEVLDLEDLARDCAEDGVHEFLFCAPPLRLVGAVGSPVSPVAVK